MYVLPRRSIFLCKRQECTRIGRQVGILILTRVNALAVSRTLYADTYGGEPERAFSALVIIIAITRADKDWGGGGSVF